MTPSSYRIPTSGRIGSVFPGFSEGVPSAKIDLRTGLKSAPEGFQNPTVSKPRIPPVQAFGRSGSGFHSTTH